MDNRAERLRGWLSPEGAEHFDDIVLTRKLGASPNIYAIGRMYRDLAENAPARGLGSTELVARVKELSGFFGELRGESSHAILTAMRIMTKGLDACVSEPLDRTREFLLKAHENYEAMSAGWTARIKEYGWNVLEDLSSMLVFDYSSTVNAMMETAAEHGKKMTVYVPESRALDGGRPFVVNALKLGHDPVFFPDAALARLHPPGGRGVHRGGDLFPRRKRRQHGGLRPRRHPLRALWKAPVCADRDDQGEHAGDRGAAQEGARTRPRTVPRVRLAG